VRLWDLGMGKAISTLTNHKRGVRALQLHPTEFTFASASPDNIKKWKFPHVRSFTSNATNLARVISSVTLVATIPLSTPLL
jgi:pleiotropic regulator 1